MSGESRGHHCHTCTLTLRSVSNILVCLTLLDLKPRWTGYRVPPGFCWSTKMELSPLSWQVQHTAVLPAEPLMCGQQGHSGADPTEKPLLHRLIWCTLLSKWPLCHRGETFCFAACLLCVRTTSSDLKTVPMPHSTRLPDSVGGKILCARHFCKRATKAKQAGGYL